jgi:hypothetical protein
MTTRATGAWLQRRWRLWVSGMAGVRILLGPLLWTTGWRWPLRAACWYAANLIGKLTLDEGISWTLVNHIQPGM